MCFTSSDMVVACRVEILKILIVHGIGSYYYTAKPHSRASYFTSLGGEVWEAYMEKTGGGCRKQSGR